MINQIENLSWSFEDDDGDPISSTLKSGRVWSGDVMSVVNHCIANHKSNATIIDVGAHIGSFSVQCAAKYPRWEVLAIEGSKKNFGHLFLNKKNNDLSNLSVFNHRNNCKEALPFMAGRNCSLCENNLKNAVILV